MRTGRGSSIGRATGNYLAGKRQAARGGLEKLMSTVPAPEPFPAMMRHWRGMRRVSQLELALRANVSARHVSFLETGRARPSRGMVLTLAAALEVPLAQRNELLGAAGFAPAYRARGSGDTALRLPEAALAWMLDRHAPYPGFALDRHWRLLRINQPAKRLLGAAGLGVGDSLLDASGPDGRLRELIVNWPDVASYLASRLQTELEHHGEDQVLASHLEAIRRDAPARGEVPKAAILPVIYRLGGQQLAFFSTIAHFGGADDIALDDIRIELMFPADEETEVLLSG